MTVLQLVRGRHVVVAALCAMAGSSALEWKRLRDLGESVEPIASARSDGSRRSAVVRADGQIAPYPGAEVVVGTDRGGTLVRLAVTETSRVAKGDLLAEVDTSEERAELAETHARAAQAEIDLKFFGVELDRSTRLVAAGAVSPDFVDRGTHDLSAARARLWEAQATSERLAAAMAKARIVAPIGGVVIRRFANQGETVPAGAQLVTIADLGQIRVEAEVDEFDAARIAPGEEVEVKAEGYGDQSWRGHVEEVPAEVAARRMKPEDPGRPSDTRVLLVKVALDEAVPLKLHQRVEVSIKSTPR